MNRPAVTPLDEFPGSDPEGKWADPASESTENERPQRPWWWRARAALGLLPGSQSSPRGLMLAVRSEDGDEVMRLLEEGVVPAKYPEVAWLCLAARRKNRALMDLLLLHGAAVDQPDRDTRGARGRTALHEAAKRGWSKGMRLLLESGANPSRPDDQGQTPLLLATRRGHREAMALLLEAGAPLAGPGGASQALLHEASSPQAVDLLVHAGAHPDEVDAFGFAPLHRHARTGRIEVITRLLFHRANPNALDRHGRTPAFWLGHGDAPAALEALLAAGLDLGIRDVEGNTAPHLLSAPVRNEALLALCHARAPQAWGVENRHGDTPCALLVRAGRVDLARRFTPSSA